MTTTTPTAPTPGDLMTPLHPTAPVDAVAERLTAAMLGAMEITAVYLGDRLGWYDALAQQGPLTPVELARATGTAERYAREWLEHQTTCGLVELVEDDGDPSARLFRLGTGAAEALTDRDSLAYVGAFGRFAAASGRALPLLLEACRTGGGVPWEALGADAREAQSALNRPLFLHALAQEIVPTLPELHAALRRDARVADVGCGEGWSSIGLARAFPDVHVDGFDVDAPSVAAARRHASTAGVAERVRFVDVDAARVDVPDGTYDVVTAFECVHDMSYPVEVLRTVRAMVRPGGYVLVMDERAAPELEPSSDDPVQRLLYGFSLICCLADGLSRPGGAGTGAVMRPSVLEAYAHEAGFARVEVLPVEHEMFRFYRLHP